MIFSLSITNYIFNPFGIMSAYKHFQKIFTNQVFWYHYKRKVEFLLFIQDIFFIDKLNLIIWKKVVSIE